MSAYHWEPHWAFMVRMTEPEPASEPPVEPVSEPQPADSLQREGKPFAWAFQTIDNRWRRRGRRGDRR